MDVSKKQVQQHWVNHWNQTQHSLNSICGVKTKERKHTNDIHEQFAIFLFLHINRELHWRYRSNITEWIIEVKHNTHWTRSGWWRQKKTHKWHPSTIHFFSFFSISTGNSIGDTGATSLSESLKSNTALTKLNLDGEYKRKNTHKWHQSTIHSFSFSIQINRKQYWRYRSSAVDWTVKN